MLCRGRDADPATCTFISRKEELSISQEKFSGPTDNTAGSNRDRVTYFSMRGRSFDPYETTHTPMERNRLRSVRTAIISGLKIL